MKTVNGIIRGKHNVGTQLRSDHEEKRQRKLMGQEHLRREGIEKLYEDFEMLRRFSEISISGHQPPCTCFDESCLRCRVAHICLIESPCDLSLETARA